MKKQIFAIVMIALVCSIPLIAANGNSDRDWADRHHNTDLECTDCHNLADPDWRACNNCHGRNDPYDEDDRGPNHETEPEMRQVSGSGRGR